ncbi:MAG: hypothetical protein ACTSVY_13290 [Candidatus Helarchaeota archaeon]
MIHKLYIITENGAAVFEKVWLEAKTTDAHLLSGFLTALSSFAVEALGSGGLQSIELENNEQLAFYRHKEKFMVVLIADNRDNKQLLNQIMKKIANTFYDEYKDSIKDANLIGKAKGFGQIIDNVILKNKTSKRTVKKVIYGTILSLLLLITLFILTMARVIKWEDFFNLTQEIDFNLVGKYMAVLSTFISALFFVPSLLVGYISGDKKWGVKSATSLMLISFILLIISQFLSPIDLGLVNIDLFPWLITFSPLIFTITILIGYLGAWIKERTKLYQLDPERIKIKNE